MDNWHLLYSEVINILRMQYLSPVLQHYHGLPYFTDEENDTQRRKRNNLLKMIKLVRTGIQSQVWLTYHTLCPKLAQIFCCKMKFTNLPPSCLYQIISKKQMRSLYKTIDYCVKAQQFTYGGEFLQRPMLLLLYVSISNNVFRGKCWRNPWIIISVWRGCKQGEIFHVAELPP